MSEKIPLIPSLDKTLSNRLHKRLWIRVMAGLVFTGLLIGSIFTTLMYRSQAEQLKTELIFETQLLCVTLESELSRYKSLAFQITSRSHIRQELEKYQLGEIDLETLVAYTAAKLADALRLDTDMVAINRLAENGQRLVNAGNPIPPALWPRKFLEESVQFGVPQNVNGRQLLVLSVPIHNLQGERIGIDLVAFDATRINEIVDNFTQSRYGSGNVRLAASTPENVEYFLTTGNKFTAQTEPIITAEVKEALHNIEEQIHLLNVGGSDNIMVHKRLGNTDWVFLFHDKATNFFKPAWIHAAYVGVSVTILTLIGITLTLLLVRPLAGRISVEADSLRHLLQSREELLGKIQLSEEQANLIINNAPDAIIVVNSRGEMVRFNPRVEKLFGYRDSEMLGKTVEMLLPDNVRDAHVALRQSYMKKPEFREVRSADFNSAVLGLNNDGSEFPVEASLSPVMINGEQHIIVAVNDISDRVAAEKALRDSDLRFRTLFEMSPDPAWIIDGHRFTECNQAAVSMLGYRSKQELLNVHPSELSPAYQPDGEASFKKAELMMDLAQKKGIHRFEWVHARADGSEFFAEVTLSAITLQEQPVIYCAWRDITERKLADSELRESETRFRSIFEGAQDGILVANIETRQFVDANPTMCAMLGYTMHELESMSVLDIHPEANLPYVIDQFEMLGKCEIRVTEDIPVLRKDGSIFNADISSSPLEYSGQHCVAGFFRDISERKKTEGELEAYRENLEELVTRRTGELRANQRRLETIIETLPIVFFIKDAEGHHLLVNRCYEEATGLSKEQVLGRTDHEIFPQDIADAMKQLDEKILAEKKPVTFEEHVPHPDGIEHDYLTTKVPLLDEQGQAYALFGLASDITQSNKMQKALLQAKEEAEHLARVKSEFLSNMSHEIRTPLNGVLGLSRMGQQADTLQKAGELFTKIIASGEHLLQVVNDILDFSRIEAGKLTLENRPIKLATTVDDVVSLVGKEAADKGLEISVQLASGLPAWVKGDPLRLRQVLLNILSNAVKFTEHGIVKLDVSTQREFLQFKISDTGIGMSEDQLTQLFKPFEQADSSTTRRFGGAGLGLSISYKLVKMMAGDIQVTSKIGEGSEFVLLLPLQETKSEPVPLKSDVPADRQRLRGIHVLVAEDVEINRLILEDILDQEGASFVSADNGQQALDLLKEQGVNTYDVVLMDIQMPVMDGYRATQHIHEIAPHLAVIGLTAHALDEEKQRCLASGMVDHITKPINVEALVTSILNNISTK